MRMKVSLARGYSLVRYPMILRVDTAASQEIGILGRVVI